MYAIKATLLGTSPPVWKRILVRRETTLRNLHRTLQTVMECSPVPYSLSGDHGFWRRLFAQVAVVRSADRGLCPATALSTAPPSPKQLPSLLRSGSQSIEPSPISWTGDLFTVFYETNAPSNRSKHLLKQCEKLEGTLAWGRSNRIGSWLFP